MSDTRKRATIRLFELISGTKIEYRHSTSDSISKTVAKGTADGIGSSQMINPYGYVSVGSQSTMSSTESRSEGTTEGNSKQEVKVPGLTPDMIVKVNDRRLLSLVHVRGMPPKARTPMGGIPTLVQGLWPFPEEVARQMTEKAWPLNPERNREYYVNKWPGRDEEQEAGRAGEGPTKAPKAQQQRPVLQKPNRVRRKRRSWARSLQL